MSRFKFVSILCGFLATICTTVAVGAGCDNTATINDSSAVDNAQVVEQAQVQYDDYGIIDIITPSDPLPDHKDKYVLEVVYGVVENKQGDGRILNGDPDYYYIHYDMSLGFEVGDIVESVMVYNPDNNTEDDIIYRNDFVVEQGQFDLIKE